MLLENERNLLVKFGLKLQQNNLTVGTGGNLSIFNREEQLIAITPSSIPYDEIKPSDICIIDIEGNIVEADQKITSEVLMHLELYKTKKNVNSVIHSHARFCTVFAVLNKPLLPVLHIFGFANTKQVEVAKYQTYGTSLLAEEVANTIGDTAKAVLLANHGVTVVGSDIYQAYNVLEEVEYCAEIQWRAMLAGNVNTLSENEVEKLNKQFYDSGY